MEQEHADLEARLADADRRRRPGRAAPRHDALPPARPGRRRGPSPARSCVDDAEAAREMLAEAAGDERGDGSRTSWRTTTAALSAVDEELRELMVPPDPYAGRDVIVEIRGAEGGEEANLFARDLYDMYRAYAGRHGLKVETLSLDASDLGGVNEVTFSVHGRRRLAAAQVRGRPAPRAAGARHREPGPHPHLVGDRARAARGRRGRGRRSTTRTSRSTCSAPAAPAARASTPPTRPCASPTCRPASSCRCRTSAASCRTAQRAMQVLRARLLEPAEQRARRRALGRAPLAGRRRRPGREDPHLQLQGEPGHRPPHRVHDLPPGRRAGRRPRRRRRRAGAPTSGPASSPTTSVT